MNKSILIFAAVVLLSFASGVFAENSKCDHLWEFLSGHDLGPVATDATDDGSGGASTNATDDGSGGASTNATDDGSGGLEIYIAYLECMIDS